MKLTHFDRALIHGLALMSRPPIVPDPADHKMIAEIVALSADRASAAGEMPALVAAAARVGATPEIHRGTAHEIAAAMDRFDRLAMAAHFDAACGRPWEGAA